MKLSLRFILITFFAFPFSVCFAQNQSDNFIYAITSIKKEGTEWMTLRKLNTQTGEFGTTLLDGSDANLPLFDAFTQKRIEHFVNDTILKNKPQLIFGSGTAALAFDKQSNRLFYTPLLVDELRYVDLNTMKTYVVPEQSFSKASNIEFQVGNAISRMVIAPDGYGYTITNDGNHLFRFNTSGNPVITDLGAIEDLASNNETIHNPCGNAGGDIVADDNSNLYLISASNKIFKIDVNSKRAQFLGIISGLPQNFTTNAAAVDDKGNLFIGSSTYTNSYFIVDPKTWNASPFIMMGQIFNSADFANSNTLFSKYSFVKANNSNKIKVYPNPIMNDQFNVQFNNLKAGNYMIELSDAVGNGVIQKKVRVTQSLQIELINITSNYNAQGFYFLRVSDENNITVFTQTMVIER